MQLLQTLGLPTAHSLREQMSLEAFLGVMSSSSLMSEEARNIVLLHLWMACAMVLKWKTAACSTRRSPSRQVEKY